MSKWLLTVLFLIVSAFLTHLIPFSLFFRYLDTTVHEFGHAAVTLLLSGKVIYIEVYQDLSGITLSHLTKSWSAVPVALAGYMTASVFAWILFALYSRGKHRQGLQAVTLIALLALILFVRNGYGMMWLIGFIAINIIVLAFAGKTISEFYYLFVAFLSLEESVFGPFSLLLLSLQYPERAGDAMVLASVTPLPAPIWAGWFTLFSLWSAKKALEAFFGRKKRGSSGKRPAINQG